MNATKGTKLYPLAFRLRESEREALKRLALMWGTTQVGVLRRLLAMTEANTKGANDERPSA